MKLRPHKNRKYAMNESYFSKIDSQNKAYILGFIMADGSVNDRSIEIRLHNKDKEVLNFIKREICPLKPLYEIKEHGWTKKQFMLKLSSVALVSDLKKIGCIQRKTFTLKFPKIESKYHHHFIRGYFDGDGCVCISNNNVVSIIGTEIFINELQKILIRKCGLSQTKLQFKKGMASVNYGGDINVLKIANYMYNNADFKMQRKFLKFEEIWENRCYGWKRKTIIKQY